MNPQLAHACADMRQVILIVASSLVLYLIVLGLHALATRFVFKPIERKLEIDHDTRIPDSAWRD